MNLREILTNAGVEENTIKTIETAMKANNIFITSEQNADIRIKKYKEKQKSLEDSITDLQEKVDAYSDFEKEKLSLTKEIENLKKEASDKDFNIALESALKEAKVKNSKLVKALLDNEKLTLKDGKLEGIDDQLKTIKEENDFLFEKIPGGVPDFSTGGKTNTESKEDSVGKRLGKQRAEQIKDSGINKFIK